MVTNSVMRSRLGRAKGLQTVMPMDLRSPMDWHSLKG
jgi:hypothetical protein